MLEILAVWLFLIGFAGWQDIYESGFTPELKPLADERSDIVWTSGLG